MTKPSPMTGRDAPFTFGMGGERWYSWWSHENDGFADFCATSEVWDNLPGGHYPKAAPTSADDVYYTRAEVSAAIDLIRSYLWRVRQWRTDALVVCDQRFYDENADRLVADGRIKGHILRTFDSFVAEAKTLTFTVKGMQTLRNMAAWWRENQQSFTARFMAKSSDSSIVFRYRADVIPDGSAFGSGPEEAPLVFEHLVEEGLLIVRGDGVRISGRGIVELERFELGGNPNVRRAFVVRSWSSDLDLVLKPIFERVGRKLGCAIKAVWEEEHVDRLDERIFRLIREASVVVADISHVETKPDRFNVGLEMGYAYALGKPIVLIRRRPPQDKDTERYVKELPFDVATLNCHDYDDTSEGKRELEAKLEARIGLALDTMPLR